MLLFDHLMQTTLLREYSSHEQTAKKWHGIFQTQHVRILSLSPLILYFDTGEAHSSIARR